MVVIRDRAVDYLADEAVALHEQGGNLGRVYDAIETAAAQWNETMPAAEAATVEEQDRAYALACRELDVTRLANGDELHPGGRREARS